MVFIHASSNPINPEEGVARTLEDEEGIKMLSGLSKKLQQYQGHLALPTTLKITLVRQKNW